MSPPTVTEVLEHLLGRLYPHDCGLTFSASPHDDLVYVTVSYCCLAATASYRVVSDGSGPWREKFDDRVDALIDALIERHRKLHGSDCPGSDDPLDRAHDGFLSGLGLKLNGGKP